MFLLIPVRIPNDSLQTSIWNKTLFMRTATNQSSNMNTMIMVLCEVDKPISVTVDSVAARLSNVSASRAGGPDNLPNWVLIY